MASQAATGIGSPHIELEKRKGISNVEVRAGYAQVRVWGLPSPLVPARLSVLQMIAAGGISVDFLKLTSDGVSFVAGERDAEAIRACLDGNVPNLSIDQGRSIVLVHAVNMRDEEGLIARILSTAIASGASVEHVGDMHNRVLLVSDNSGAEQICSKIRSELVEADA